MKSYLPLFMALFFLISCESKNEAPKPTLKPVNYHVIIDVSQRAKQSFAPDQYAIDMNYLQHVIDAFENRVKSLGYIGSRDRLRIVLVYGKEHNGKLIDEKQEVSVILSELPIKDRKKIFTSKIAEMKQIIQNRYKEIASNSDAGSCDLISQFKDYYQPKKGAKNYVFLITDGLLSFTHKIRERNRTSYIPWEELSIYDWKSKFVTEDYGFLKVKRSYPETKIVLMGFDIKKSNDFYAKEKGVIYWESWFNEMGVKEVFFYENMNTPHFILNDFAENLELNK